MGEVFFLVPGLDWGGLSREFFQLICVELFDASNKLFMRFSEENHQALVSLGGREGKGEEEEGGREEEEGVREEEEGGREGGGRKRREGRRKRREGGRKRREGGGDR